MYGAFGLKPGTMQGEILLNLDSEDEGELYIGCAGGLDITATLEYKEETPMADFVARKITLKGLRGDVYKRQRTSWVASSVSIWSSIAFSFSLMAFFFSRFSCSTLRCEEAVSYTHLHWSSGSGELLLPQLVRVVRNRIIAAAVWIRAAMVEWQKVFIIAWIL